MTVNYNVVVKPQEGSQSLSISCPCDEILYEGTRGPGKTAAQLLRFRRLVGVGYGAFWIGLAKTQEAGRHRPENRSAFL